MIPFSKEVGHFDPYNLFDEIVDVESGVKPSSPKMTPFSALPEERRSTVLAITPAAADVVNLSKSESHELFTNAEMYSQQIIPCAVNKKIGLEFNFKYKSSNYSADYVVCEKQPGRESRITFIDLKYPNGWSAQEAIGKSFGYLHENVKNHRGELIMPKPERIVSGILNSPEPMERVGAVSIRQDSILNRHPEFYEPTEFDFDKNPNLYMRIERQSITPRKDLNAFLFVIQTYFVDLTEKERALKFLKAMKNTGKDVYFRHLVESEKWPRIIKRLESAVNS